MNHLHPSPRSTPVRGLENKNYYSCSNDMKWPAITETLHLYAITYGLKLLNLVIYSALTEGFFFGCSIFSHNLPANSFNFIRSLSN